jgi:2-polyprenyl-3-methyl-5-hydroxy-6-metoxy-1,4-benzoquinol methylase
MKKFFSGILRIISLLLLKVGPPLIVWTGKFMRENQPVPNLEGDREVEWSWVISHLGTGPGEVLDFGCGNNMLSFIAARLGYNVTAIDLQAIRWPYTLANMRFIQGDIIKTAFPATSFDIIINCSSIEHVGLSGRYGSDENPQGDFLAMARLRDLLKPDGAMLLTIPVGIDAVIAPLHRVYGRERLPRLLENWVVEKKEFWVKDDRNLWISASESEALSFLPTKYCYGLGCFVLRKNKDG